VKEDLLGLSEYVFNRTRRRLEGLTDDEYLWEPVAGCWSVRVGSGENLAVDLEPGVQQGSFTTIAWRTWHLILCYGAARNEIWLRGSDDGAEEARCLPQATAAGAVGALDAANQWWQALLEGLTEAGLADDLGPIAGPYSQSSRGSFVLHQLDEQIHHGAEIGVLRDLHAARFLPRT
jgi:hypothetical protein